MNHQKNIGIVLSYANIIIFILSNLLYTPIMIKILGQSEFGIYSLCSSIIGYLGLLNVGFSSTYMRYYTKYKVVQDEKNINILNGMFAKVFFFIAIIVLIAGAIIIVNLDSILGNKLTDSELFLAKLLLSILTVNMAVMMPANVFTAFIVAHERFVVVKSVELLRTVCSPIISLPVLLYGFGSVGMSYVVLGCTIMGLLINMYYCFKILSTKFDFSYFDWKVFKEMIYFSFFIFLQGIMDQFNWQIGKLILARICGSAAIAVYSVGLQFNMIFLSLSTVISGVFIPQVYQLIHEKKSVERLNSLFVKIGRCQFYIVFYIWSSFFLYGKSFILLWVGLAYENAYYIGLLLMTPIIVALTQSIAIEILRAYNKHALWNVMNLIIACINVLISIPLTIRYQEFGSALGSCITMGFTTIFLHGIYYHKTVKLDILGFFKSFSSFLFPCMLILFIGKTILYLESISTWNELICSIIIFSVIYFIIMLKFAFNQEEKLYFYSQVSKVRQLNVRK